MPPPPPKDPPRPATPVVRGTPVPGTQPPPAAGRAPSASSGRPGHVPGATGAGHVPGPAGAGRAAPGSIAPRGPSHPGASARPSTPVVAQAPETFELPADALLTAPEEAPVALGEEDLVLETPAVVDDVPLLDGLEATHVEDRPRRRGREKAGTAQPNERAAFVYTACPACGAAQGDAPSAFCETCGQSLKPPSRRAQAAEDGAPRCRECGLRGRIGSSNCINCGTRL